MKKILLTGATGFIGRHFLKALYEKGYKVTVLVRSSNNHFKEFGKELNTVILPDPILNDFKMLLNKRFDAVCHLAAFTPANHLDPAFAKECIETNSMLTLQLLQASLENGIDRFLYFSAGNIYYVNDSIEPAGEMDLIYPSRFSPYYLGSKMLGEIFVDHFRQNHGINTISLRISSPYGLGMPKQSAVIKLIERTMKGLPVKLYDGKIYKTDFVYVGDVVGAALSAIEGGSPGIYNIGSGEATSLVELARTIGKVFGKSVPIEIVDTGTEYHRKGFRHLDIKKARTAWNWYPRSLEEGLKLMFEQMSK